MRNRPLSDSSMTGAPNVAATYSPVDVPSRGIVTNSRSAVLMISAVSAAMPAPQPNANARLARGSGSSRSIHSTSTTSSGTGSSARGSAIANGAAPSPAANNSTAPVPTARTAPAGEPGMLQMNPPGARPAGRPARTARGLNGSPAAGDGPDSFTGSSLL